MGTGEPGVQAAGTLAACDLEVESWHTNDTEPIQIPANKAFTTGTLAKR